jgi:hypothetical protein
MLMDKEAEGVFFSRYWSGMASLGVAYLMFIAPVVMTAVAIKLYLKRKVSFYHCGSFLACAGYVLLPIAVVLSSVLAARLGE